MTVTALHPLMADLARQVGGERVTVHDLVGEGGNPHKFQPRPADLKKMSESTVILASGKGMENYLDRIRAAVKEVPVVEVGETIPSLQFADGEHSSCEHHGHDHHHDHSHSSIDPHWWHGIENMRRATKVIAKELSIKDPEGADYYKTRATTYSEKLGKLKQWAKSKLTRIPKENRKLVTAHNAFGYFAHEFGYEAIAVAGLNREQNSTPKERAKTIAAVKESNVTAIFPEYGVNEKELEAIAKVAGKKVAPPLISDGNGKGELATFEGMLRHNVTAVCSALTDL